jgi:hypothetical protein
MGALLGVLASAGFGMLTMYVLDPVAGRRRRAQARNKLTHYQNQAKQAALVTATDLKNRALGIVAEGRARILGNHVDDTVLGERVRAKLGFLVRHPSAIEVAVNQGHVTLRGPVLADEVQQLVRGVETVRGVREVENHLEVHVKAEDVPSLQGATEKRTGQRLDIFQRHWSPSTRLLVGLAGAVLILTAERYRNELAPLPALLALGFLAYGLAQQGAQNRPTRETKKTDARSAAVQPASLQ